MKRIWKFLCYFFRFLGLKIIKKMKTDQQLEVSEIDFSTVHLLFFYRDFKKYNYHSHVGLGVSSMHASKVLGKKEIDHCSHGIWDGYDIAKILRENPQTTHAVIEAPWIGARDLKKVLLDQFPNIKFVVRCHSQIAFLQVEPGALGLIRGYLELQKEAKNFTFAGNNKRFCNWITDTYGDRCVYLPNLYDLSFVTETPPKVRDENVLKVSSFGATRLQKNHASAAAAAMLLARERNVNLEFYVNSNREEHGKGVLQTLEHMFNGLSWAKLVQVPWQSWEDFRKTISEMDLAFQLSSTETFNITTADAVAEHVPVVTSTAIQWLPDQFHVHNIDNLHEISKTASRVLDDPNSASEALSALEKYMEESLQEWLKFLSVKSV